MWPEPLCWYGVEKTELDMNWEVFPYFAVVSVVLSLGGALVALFKPRYTFVAQVLALAGIGVLGVFVAGFWVSLGRPPMRTMGETRLWYSLFVMMAGFFVYRRWNYRWLLLFTTVLSAVFCIINMLKPEIHDATLVPALQSVYFIPHVAVYMFAYGILACSFILAVVGLFDKKNLYFDSMDNLVYIATGLLFLGLLTGALWAKEAWGDFWSWDPKETWAAVTAAGYLAYIHLRFTRASKSRWLYFVVVVSFLLLQMCWYGYKYLPSSGQSLHLYNMQ